MKPYFSDINFKLVSTLILLVLSVPNLGAQNCEEFVLHLRSIDSTFNAGVSEDRPDSVINTNGAFVDYTIDHLLENPSYKCLIANRYLLTPLKTIRCDSNVIVIDNILMSGKSCTIRIESGEFNADEHQIIRNSDSTLIETIDSRIPYGAWYGIPYKGISSLSIKIGDAELDIPEYAFGNIFESNFCDNYHFYRPIEAFESLDGEYLYIYIYGGDAAGTYFAKLIFNHNKYLTKIVAEYFPLSRYGSFREDFIGF